MAKKIQQEELLKEIEQRQHPEDVAHVEPEKQENKLDQTREKVRDFIEKQEHRSDHIQEQHGLSLVEILPDELPSYRYYPKGTKIYLKSPTLGEIIDFSHINPSSVSDIRRKMDMLLERCVVVVLPSGKRVGHYYIKEPDRVYLVLILRELTFPEGQYYTQKCQCSQCGESTDVPLIRKYINNKQLDPEIEEYFIEEISAYEFPTIKEENLTLGIPTIGLQSQMNQKWETLSEEDKGDSVLAEFFRIIPYIVYDRVLIDDDVFDELKQVFDDLENDTYAFLNEVSKKIRPGIKSLSWKCKCGSSEETRVRFRNGLEDLFNLPGGFRTYIRKPVSTPQEEQDQ